MNKILSVPFLNQKPSVKNLTILFLAAFIVRAAVFVFYIQHNERYHQADSNDYHSCAYLLNFYQSLTRPDSGEPIFWRTPGYPLFLMPFYYFQQYQQPAFENYTNAHTSAISAQIILCSCIPLLLFFLAFFLTSSYVIAWLIGWVSAFHLGFILAALYLLTDGPASLFFYLFLFWYYQAWNVIGYKKQISKRWMLLLIGAALSLAAYAWMRPMGVFVALFSAGLLLISNDSLTTKIKKMVLFLVIFFSGLGPWYLRNYNLTGKLFFCPMSGGILQAFCAPKIVRRIHKMPLETCTRALYVQVCQRAEQQESLLRAQGSNQHVSKHLICGDVAWPWVTQYPFFFLYDWIIQVLKTTFDLYSYQLVAFTNNSYMYDPIEEFLTEKVAACLYTAPIPWWMRMVSWLEFIFYIFVWIGLLAGTWLFVFRDVYNAWRKRRYISSDSNTWIKLLPMIGAVIVMTGGFGYARLRLPVEPLMLILALIFWIYILDNKKHERSA